VSDTINNRNINGEKQQGQRRCFIADAKISIIHQNERKNGCYNMKRVLHLIRKNSYLCKTMNNSGLFVKSLLINELQNS
jgi:hypothetical protein